MYFCFCDTSINFHSDILMSSTVKLRQYIP